MSIYFLRFLPVLFFGSAFLGAVSCTGINTPVKTVAAKSDDSAVISKQVVSSTPPITAKGEQTAVFAGGCFWGVEAVFEHVKGVSDVTSGYSGGTAKTADYEMVSAGKTGHAEAVKITFDPSQVSYEQLLKVFFSVAHDPTELNRQGPDIGKQYRSAIFYSNEEQKRLAESYIAELTKAKTFKRPIVTQIVALDTYYQAEDYHQNYLVRHPNESYIVIHDKPKLKNLRKQFPDLYVSK
ncbi:MAG: peptide-methionine (S)-S-oxide reductase MsrA [Acidobacteria bacterium]|nr:peptide-methionine (S)-S-oxide reductase MsrA [Acidobacteriota bacterium]MCA1639530.1 peptide-methionine (S)-S-oxide reductase MsrA [Acidobacteriota bacterium]